MTGSGGNGTIRTKAPTRAERGKRMEIRQREVSFPRPVLFLMERLAAGGHEGWAVGGCVRDSLLGRVPHDWDLCTDALPDQMRECFAGLPVIETGLAHGTLTVLVDRVPYEVTTYRVDGAYTDHRRPDGVRFVGRLEEDLARRDFTINAMAARPGRLEDPFGGRQDLAAGRVRCVGEAKLRFEEDGLRILRAMRFAASLNFEVEEATAAAMEQTAPLLEYISRERVFAELCRLLTGPGAAPVLERFPDLLQWVLPEIGPCRGFATFHPTHCRDVWGHTLEALGKSEPDLAVRWALLLHDLAKPGCFVRDEEGVGHCPGHGELGALQAGQILDRLRAPHKLRDQVVFLVRYHDASLPLTEKGIRAWLRKAGEENLRRLLEVKRCDLAAHRPLEPIRRAREDCGRFEALLEQVLAQPPLWNMKDLAISGRELMELGMKPGPDMGRLLQELFDQVEEGTLPNEGQALCRAAADRLNKKKNPDAP